MYLTIKEHDDLRSLLMGFEIPFRNYIENVVSLKYHTETPFAVEMNKKRTNASTTQNVYVAKAFYPFNNSPMDSFKKMFKRLMNAKLALTPHSVEIDVPYVSQLCLICMALKEDFNPFHSVFPSYEKFCMLIDKYSFARNKLSHPGCKTLDEEDLIPVLLFLEYSLSFLDDIYFSSKSKNEISLELRALQTRKKLVPVAINNFTAIPFCNNSVVCREEEIENIKQFLYGRPDDLRKKHSCCIYGYGGIGKTALVTETVKQVVQDLMNSATRCSYSPKYILFFSAKQSKLELSNETGRIVEKEVPFQFTTADELINGILLHLDRKDLVGFHDEGLIIVDNLESLSLEDKSIIKRYIELQTPSEMQFIITSRHCEDFEMNIKLGGFGGVQGKRFIKCYTEENALDIKLTDELISQILNAAKGNTLVLVLIIRRLSSNLLPSASLRNDFYFNKAWDAIQTNLLALPPDAHDIIGEFIYKNTFEQLEDILKDNKTTLFRVLKIFAVITNSSVDYSTICILINDDYHSIEMVMDMLCNYLLIEQTDSGYVLNSFAKNYIIDRFIPDSNSYSELVSQINNKKNEIANSLAALERDIKKFPVFKQIMQDWAIYTTIDKIGASRFYLLYKEIANARLEDLKQIALRFEDECINTERLTSHPYIKFQKAKILQLLSRRKVYTDCNERIRKAFADTIYYIKRLDQFTCIMETKSYASLLWLYGMFLAEQKELIDAIRYLEDSKKCFESLNIDDKEYFKCVIRLAYAYIDQYKLHKQTIYLEMAKDIDSNLDAGISTMTDKDIIRRVTSLKKTLSLYR